MAISLETLRRSAPKPPRIVIYGIQGIGKTTLAANLDNPVFLLPEDGLAVKPDIPYWPLQNYADAIEAISVLHSEHQFDAVVLDTVSAFEPMLHAALMAKWGEDSLEKIGSNGGGFFKWQTESLPLWQDLLDGFDSLRENKGMQVVLIGHSVDVEIRPPDADPYRKYSLDLINKKATSLLFRWPDAVLFCNYRMAVTGAVKDKKGNVTRAGRAIGSGERVIYTSERPAWYAKNRYDLPDELVLDREGTALSESLASALGYAESSKPKGR